MNNFCLIFCIVPFCTTLAPQTYPENIVSIKDREEASLLVHYFYEAKLILILRQGVLFFGHFISILDRMHRAHYILSNFAGRTSKILFAILIK